MRRKAMRLPDVPHRRGRKSDRLRHRAQRPVGRLVQWSGLGEADDLRHHLIRRLRDAGRARLLAQQAGDAFGHEPLLPPPDAGLRLARR